MLETIGIYLMGVIFAVALLAKLISYFTIRKMAKAASDIQKSNHKFMKLVKGKFEYASMVSDRVQNVTAFVEKYLYEYKVLGIKLYLLRSLPVKLIWAEVFLGMLCAFACYKGEGVTVSFLQYIEWTAIFAFALILLYYLLEEEIRIHGIKNYMVEYLENVCVRRYEKANQASRVKEEEQEEKEPEIKEPEAKQKSEQEIRIRAILEEFMA